MCELRPDADALVEGKTPDFSVSIRDNTAANTGNVPTAVTLQSLTARGGAPTGLLAIALGTLLSALALLGVAALRRRTFR